MRRIYSYEFHWLAKFRVQTNLEDLGLSGPPWGPQEALGAFSSLRAPVRLRALFPSLPHSPHPLSLPGLQTSLRPQEDLGTFRSLRHPWGLNQTQGPCSPCSLTPLLPSLLYSEPLWLPGASLGSQKALRTFGSLWQPWSLSQTQRPCLPTSLAPLLPLTPHFPSPWASLAPRTSLGSQGTFRAFGSLQQPWGLSQTQGPCFPCFLYPWSLAPLLPSPPHLPGYLGPQEAFGSFGALVRLRGKESQGSQGAKWSKGTRGSKGNKVPECYWGPNAAKGSQASKGSQGFWGPQGGSRGPGRLIGFRGKEAKGSKGKKVSERATWWNFHSLILLLLW